MNTRPKHRSRPQFDRLDERVLLSTTPYLTPAQLRNIYGLNSVPNFNIGGHLTPTDGRGQTIAIIAEGDDPAIYDDVNTFDAMYSTTGLPGAPNLYAAYGPSQSWLSEPGDPYLPAATRNAGTAGETALDVEWAHAIAPGAKIDLVEVNIQSFPNLSGYADQADTLAMAAGYAATLPGVSVVSISYGVSEPAPGFNLPSTLETQFDHYFTTPAGHTPVTFIAATGDTGSIYNPSTVLGGPAYPSTSPNVLAVGGSTLLLNSSGAVTAETGWSSAANYPVAGFPAGGSGGGVSLVEKEPSYQGSVQSSRMRTVPDVSYNAGWPVSVVNSYGTPSALNGEEGTSCGAPQWAGLIAIADEGRFLSGKANLDGPSQVLPAIYTSQFAGAFHDITTGVSTGYYSPGPGYDLVTGLGTPNEPVLIGDLITQIGGGTAAVAHAVQSPAVQSTGPVATTSTGVAAPSFAMIAALPTAATPAAPSAAKATATKAPAAADFVATRARFVVVDRALDDLGPLAGIRGKAAGLLEGR